MVNKKPSETLFLVAWDPGNWPTLVEIHPDSDTNASMRNQSWKNLAQCFSSLFPIPGCFQHNLVIFLISYTLMSFSKMLMFSARYYVNILVWAQSPGSLISFGNEITCWHLLTVCYFLWSFHLLGRISSSPKKGCSEFQWGIESKRIKCLLTMCISLCSPEKKSE